MSDWIAVSRTQHADKHVLSRDAYHFAEKERTPTLFPKKLKRHPLCSPPLCS
ncbi:MULTISPECIES: hypothetical protein [Halomonas]|uniref:hypothetical protein n=1 Tax=Halomonas TaxID=2745 RepID=UPI0014150326|nr:hypothetical protein [Halomonas ventosae]